MANDNSNSITAWSFLNSSDAINHFAKIDYALKNGVHIQRWSEQIPWFSFISENELSLKLYYETYFGVMLESGGETIHKYYYLDFHSSSRGNIPPENRHFLQNEYVIVGFILYKAINIDRNVDLGSVKEFLKLIKNDYEEYKSDLFRILAKAKNQNITQMNHEKMNAIVISAMKVFDKLGWIELKDDAFDVLPAFERLPKIYEDYILDLENWIKTKA